MMRRTMVVVAIVSLLIAGASVASAASRKSGGGGSSIWVDTGALRSTDGSLHYGDQMNFGYVSAYSATDGSGPWLQLQCYQGGVLVFSDVRAGFEGGYGYGVPFQLGPSLRWTGGDAVCNGVLGHQGSRSFVADAKTSFTAKG